ncbi:TspO/MBR family protein [Streptomyces caeni]|uniref:TspO/MBR family protein n=1 Tax=Streptomyces caeni TaxID=2307231 RepID=A0ABW4IQ47_9ACTN
MWTPLYASVAWAGGRAPARARGGQRRAVATGLAADLALNADWNRLFLGCRSPKAGVVGTLLLDISSAALIRRSVRAGTTAALALVPHAAWCGFATALNLSVARRNP